MSSKLYCIVFQSFDFYVEFMICRYWFAPVGISLGIKNTKPKKAPPNAVLERAYLLKGTIRHKQVRASVLCIRICIH
jgi:ceramide synthetase